MKPGETADRVDADAARRVGGGRATHEAGHGGLGHRDRFVVGDADVPDHGRDQHRSARPLRRAQRLDEGGEREERRVEIGAEAGAICGLLGPMQRGDQRAAGAVDQRRWQAERLGTLRDRGARAFGGRDIGFDAQRFRRASTLKTRSSAADERETPAGFSQVRGHCAAEAAAGAGDQGNVFIHEDARDQRVDGLKCFTPS